MCVLSHIRLFCNPNELQLTRFLCPWNLLGKNTRVGSQFLLLGIFPTQASNMCLLHLLHQQVDSSPLSHLGSPPRVIQDRGKQRNLDHKVEYVYCLVTKSCLTFLLPHEPQPARLFCPWDFPGKTIGVGCYFLLQGILLTQGLNPCLRHLTCGFFTTEPPGKPRENYLRMKPTL